MSTLDEQVEKKRKEIHTDAYPMSIGEVVNIYIDNELDIHPEFQRAYRWTQLQKSKLIESILLGIPLPSFFVAQRDDGVWDVVDGLQRLATIFSFLGIYKDEHNKVGPALELIETEYLPGLKGKYWSEEFGKSCISKDLQRAFKREKIDLKIIKRESDKYTKYELFQRLNTLGSSLSDQEVRNCLLLMIDKTVYQWLMELSENGDFKAVLPLTDRQLKEQYHVELALRFLILKDIDIVNIGDLSDMGDFLTEGMRTLASDITSGTLNKEVESQKFSKTFKMLNTALGENAFKRFKEDRYSGPFSLATFEAIGLGLGHHIDQYYEGNQDHLGKIQEASKQLGRNEVFVSNTIPGNKASKRLPNILPIGRELLKI
ncbi:MAG: DUF262 domain-containing protein [Bacteroidetes bacterium]|nr:MAG: DUF262 domain-containing protein [Bacteroidota bacterium]